MMTQNELAQLDMMALSIVKPSYMLAAVEHTKVDGKIALLDQLGKKCENDPELHEVAVQVAKKLLSDNNWDVRKGALQIIAIVSDKSSSLINDDITKAVAKIAATETSHSELRELAQQTLTTLLDKKPEQKSALLDTVVHAFADDSSSTRTASLQTLIIILGMECARDRRTHNIIKDALKDTAPEVRTEGLRTLAIYLEKMFRDMNSAPILKNVLDIAVRDPHPSTRIQGQKTLGVMCQKSLNCDLAMSIVVKDAQSPQSEIRAGALQSMAVMTGMLDMAGGLTERAIAAATSGIKSDSWEVRAAACDLFTPIFTKKPDIANIPTTRDLADLAVKDQHPAVSAAAHRALDAIAAGNPDMRKHILPSLEIPDIANVQKVILALQHRPRLLRTFPISRYV